MRAIHKFNNGYGATLCNQCRCIIGRGLHNAVLCENCIKKQQTNTDKTMTQDEKILLDWYGQGWHDELWGWADANIKFIADEYLPAYKLGRDHAILGDESDLIESMADRAILKQILERSDR